MLAWVCHVLIVVLYLGPRQISLQVGFQSRLFHTPVGDTHALPIRGLKKMAKRMVANRRHGMGWIGDKKAITKPIIAINWSPKLFGMLLWVVRSWSFSSYKTCKIEHITNERQNVAFMTCLATKAATTPTLKWIIDQGVNTAGSWKANKAEKHPFQLQTSFHTYLVKYKKKVLQRFTFQTHNNSSSLQFGLSKRLHRILMFKDPHTSQFHILPHQFADVHLRSPWFTLNSCIHRLNTLHTPTRPE
jgi:hypothetical protein